jgi:Spy/CpxP family protein refolding chaperone
MTPTWHFRWVVAVLLVAVAPAVHAQSFGFPWWRDAQFQRELSLTADQTARIEALFQSTITQLRAKKAELDLQEDDLSRLIAANADEQQVIKQVDRVESIRSHLNKMRTLQLLHIRQVLTPEQRVKLNKLHEQWEQDHGRGRGNSKGRGDGKSGRGEGRK